MLLQVVSDRAAEIAAYRRWAENRLVDAVVLVNRAAEAERLGVLRDLGPPTVVAGGPADAAPGVRTDDGGAARPVPGGRAAAHTISLDVHRFGELVAEAVLELIDGKPVAERWCPTALLVPRGTTAPVT